MSPSTVRLAVALWLGLPTVDASQLEAQTRIAHEPVFTSFAMEDGLSQSTVRALVQDRSGFLWIGTQGGLNRFDGSSFRVYGPRSDDSLSLRDSFILALALADDDRLWVGTLEGGLDLFDPVSGNAEHFGLSELGPWRRDGSDAAEALPAADNAQAQDGASIEAESGRTVENIVLMPDGRLLLDTDVGLVRFDPATGRGIPITSDAAVRGMNPTAMCALPGRGALVGFPGGSIIRVPPVGSAEVELRLSEEIRALRCPDEQHRGFAATLDGSVYAIELESRTFERLARLQSASGNGLMIRDVLSDTDGVWISTSTGLYLKEIAQPDARRVGADGFRSLPGDNVTRFLLDATGVLWIGTWNGLASLHPSTMALERVFNSSGDMAGFAGNGVVTIEGGDEGEYWIGTMSGGVHLMSRGDDGGEITLIQPEALAPLATTPVFDLALDEAGRLWIATLGSGVARLDAARRQLTRVSTVGDRLAYTIVADHQGDVWVGAGNEGLLRLDPTTDAFERFRGPENDWDFGSEFVWPIVEDGRGNLWVGAKDGWVSSISPDRNSVTAYANAPGLMSDRFLTLFSDSRGNLWIGTEGAGLHRLDPQTGDIRVYTVEHGLPHNNVQAIEEDGAGGLWISTNGGLALFDPETEEFREYREAVGLAGNRFYANGAYRNDRGEIFFGGERGLTILDPSRLKGRAPPPAVAVTSFRVRNKEEPLARAVAAGGLDLGPDEEFFAFEFAALDFRDPTQNRYKYQLDPLDENWVEAGSVPVANYTSVPAGKYTFKVAARNSDGVWNDDALSILVRVRAHYYETVWFQALVALAVLGVISALYFYRLSQLHARQALRLGIAGQLHDDIGANLATIALKADAVGKATGLDEKRRRQLGDVGRLAREATHKVRETVWVVNTQYDTVAGLIRKMSDTAGLMLNGQISHAFQLPAEIPDRPIDMELRQDVYLIFKESLQNILKHSDANNVAINVTYNHPKLAVEVRDDGKGFVPLDPADGREGSGLRLMEHRAGKHGGHLTRSSKPGRGTTVRLDVRVK